MEHELSAPVEEQIANECWALVVWLRAYIMNPTLVWLLNTEQKSIVSCSSIFF
jgi:hypothetical protein